MAVSVKDLALIISDLQNKNPELFLCGSAALILAGYLDERVISDIDFVLRAKDLKAIIGVSGLRKDRYPNDVQDGYSSWHCSYKHCTINLLAFDDDNTSFDTETITHSGKTIEVQKVDDILRWKKKYNRSKDIKDLNNIANKLIEDLLVS